MDGWQGNVNLYAPDSDLLQWGVFSGGSLPIDLSLESRYIGCVELSDNFFAESSQRTCCPLQAMPGEEVVDLRHHRETPCKYPPLKSECSSHHSFISKELGVGVDLKLPVDTPPVGLVSGWGGDLCW